MLGGGPAQQHAIAAAEALGAATLVCDEDPTRGDVPVSSEDLEGVRRAASNADGVIAPGTDWPVRIAAYVAEDLGLRHPIDVPTAVRCTNKLAQRMRLDDAGVAQPRWSAEEPPAYPCVVKPIDRQGQRGLAFVADRHRLATAAEAARLASRSGRVLFEEFVPGAEVTVNAFSLAGRFFPLTVTDRVHFSEARGVAHRHVYPPAADAAAAVAAAEAAVGALGIERGPSYVQLILSPGGARVIEVAARLGGGHDSELCRATTGVDLAGAAVRCALSLPVTAASLTPEPACAGVIEFLSAHPGTLVRAEGPANAVFYHGPGHVYGPLRQGPDRAGYVLALGSDREAALAAARRAVEETSLVTL